MITKTPAPKKTIRVCALVPYPANTTPSQRFRIEQWLAQLRANDISIDLVPFADHALLNVLHKPGHFMAKTAAMTTAFLRRLAVVVTARRYDAVLIHRAACIAGPAIIERAIALLRRPIIFDFDDAIYLLHTTGANRRFGWLKFPGKTAAICRLSSHVVVGNSFLAEFASRHNPNVTVIPSSVDTKRFRPRENRSANGRVVVGWTGSSTSQTHLEMFAPVLKELTARRDVELRIHSDREPVLPGVAFVWRRWSADTEIEELAQFDIGIMPMPDDLWARGKCAMKALLYMAMGIPAVCSAVGTNREVIQHGENGFLATTAEEFLMHLVALVDDELLRQRIGEAARRTVEEFYSVDRCARQLARVIQDSVARSGVVTPNFEKAVVTKVPLNDSQE